MARLPSVLLIGKNGSGKTTVGLALEILQKIARGTNRVDNLVKPKDLSGGRRNVPVRFEIEVDLKGTIYEYAIALEFPPGFKELRVLEEKLLVDGSPVYTRELAQVNLARTRLGLASLAGATASNFGIDWHLVALPIVQESQIGGAQRNYPEGPLSLFKTWLGRMLVLRPTPGSIIGDSDQETLEPKPNVTDFGAWFAGLMAYAPAAYGKVDEYLKLVMPDLQDITNPPTGKESRSLIVQFSNEQGRLSIPFEDLSDGEKCFMICALVLAANRAHGPVLCFWDEPDSYLALDEVGHFVTGLRQAFQSGGQLIATSHNPEAIRSFSNENTLLLHRKNHLEPTMARPLSELNINGDLVGALARGDITP